VRNKILRQFNVLSFDRVGFQKQAITSSAVATRILSNWQFVFHTLLVVSSSAEF